AAGDGVGDQLFVPFAPGTAVVDLRDRLAEPVKAVGVDPGEGADSAGGRPGARALAVRHRNALTAFDQRQYLVPRYHQGDKRSHPKGSPSRGGTGRRFQYYIGSVGKNGSDPPAEQLPGPRRVIDRIREKRIARLDDLRRGGFGQLRFADMDGGAAE